MAVFSGAFSTPGTSASITLQLIVTQASQSIANNTSTLNWTLQAVKGSAGYPSSYAGRGSSNAYVNGWGEITQITETKPGKKPIVLDEVIIVAYGPQGVEKPARSSNGKKDLLNQEGALQVKHLPALKIPEYYNQWLMFQFKFVLQ